MPPACENARSSRILKAPRPPSPAPEPELFSSPSLARTHTRTRIPTQVSLQCLGCKTVLTGAERAICANCRPREVEVYYSKLLAVKEAETLFSRLWTQCQRCQVCSHMLSTPYSEPSPSPNTSLLHEAARG